MPSAIPPPRHVGGAATATPAGSELYLAAGSKSDAFRSTGVALGEGPVRLWQGMLIQSLDPLPRRGVATPGNQTRFAALARQGHASGQLVRPARHPRPRPRTWILSNEHTVSRWAYPEQLAAVYTYPRMQGRVLSRLRWYTDDGFPELYPLLRLHRDASGQDWIQVRIPMGPAGRVGWVRREGLGKIQTTGDLLVVDRDRHRMEFFTDGRSVWSAPVGVGDARAPTSAGQFWIRKRFKIFDPSSAYWPYAFGTTDYSPLNDWPVSGMVGIRGPDFEPPAISTGASNGSMRVGVADDTWLANHLGLGTPLHVR